MLVCEAQTERGEIPEESLRNIKTRAGYDVSRIEEIEKNTKHDVIAFLTSVTEKVGEDGRFIHMGLTSSDVLDTSLAMLLKEASDILIEDIDNLLAVLKKKAWAYKDVLMIGVPLEEQFVRRPDLEGVVQAIRGNAASREAELVQQAEETGHRRLDEEYRQVFELVRRQAAQGPREK